MVLNLREGASRSRMPPGSRCSWNRPEKVLSRASPHVALQELGDHPHRLRRPGELSAFGRIAKLGKSIGFLKSELRNADGDLLAYATSTAKIIRKKPGA